MKKLIYFVGTIMLPLIGFAQPHPSRIKGLSKDVTAMYIVKLENPSREIVTQSLIMDMNDVESMEAMPNEDVKKRFGTAKHFVVLIVKPKPSVNLISGEQFYQKRGFANKAKGLASINVDGQKLSSANALIQEKEVESAKLNDSGEVTITSRNHAKSVKHNNGNLNN